MAGVRLSLLGLRRWINPDPTVAFESRLYLYCSFWAAFFGLGMLFLNLGPEWHWEHTVAIFGIAVVNGAFFALARWGRHFLPFSFILANAGMTFWVWLFNQGALGSLTYYYIASFLYGFLLLRGRKRALALSMTTAVVVLGFVLDAANPGLTDALFRYPSRVYAIIDMGTGFLSALLIISITIGLLVKNFDLERKLTDRRLRDLSMRAQTDALTGLGNRAWIDLKLSEALEAESGDSPISVVLADIDHFKSINDDYGHVVGDTVLRGVATVFRQVVRRTDAVGRYGGEEFIVILSHTRKEEAGILAEKIRVRLASTDFPPLALPVTSSFGIAEYRPGESLAALVARADEALYRAKAEGRNRVLVETFPS